MIIAHQCTVAIHYRLTDESGTLLDTSHGKSPLEYVHGAQQIIPGLESALTGKTTGDHLIIRLQPEEGYGSVDQDLIKTMPRTAFSGLEPLERGMCFEAIQPDGQKKLMTLLAVSPETVTVDENHPLAGKVLRFDVRVERVRRDFVEESTAEYVSRF